MLVAEFVNRSGGKTLTIRKEITLYPPDRITYRYLAGPLPPAGEEITLFDAGDGRTALLYRGEFEVGSPLGYLSGPLYTRRLLDRLAREHLHDIKAAAEARAAGTRKMAEPSRE